MGVLRNKLKRVPALRSKTAAHMQFTDVPL